ncbi:hypothetical protein PIB30_030254 [Stylosanthes scabra]|uniref:Uncharacterized protein n=1 Tax=Stylosanthes scabra TaxID=79078 RepID=A0ABU6X951_9FABA|nr:hypothetical protein [Stylosanthes scabra]
MVMSVVKNQGQHIQTLTNVIAQYGEVLHALTSSGFAYGTSKKGRRLDFEVEEIAPNEIFINIRQQGLGSPFMIYPYKGMNMLMEDTPKCLDLVFWPTEGMAFVGFELPIAAYVFSNGLYMS